MDSDDDFFVLDRRDNKQRFERISKEAKKIKKKNKKKTKTNKSINGLDPDKVLDLHGVQIGHNGSSSIINNSNNSTLSHTESGMSDSGDGTKVRVARPSPAISSIMQQIEDVEHSDAGFGRDLPSSSSAATATATNSQAKNGGNDNFIVSNANDSHTNYKTRSRSSLPAAPVNSYIAPYNTDPIDDDFDIASIQEKFKKVGSQIKESMQTIKAANRDNKNNVITDVDQQGVLDSSGGNRLSPSPAGAGISGIRVDEASRIYHFTIISKLPFSENLETNVEVTGSKKFRKVMLATLQNIAKTVFIPPEYRTVYKVSEVVLVWKSKIKIFEYMQPSFLNLPLPLVAGGRTFVTVHIMTKADAERQDQSGNILVNDDAGFEEEEVEVLSDFEQDNDDDDDDDGQPDQQQQQQEEEDGYFTISLKDKDNMKFEIKVNSATRLQKVAEWYLGKKGLASNARISLIFDDEPLLLRKTVGDTELEDEFVVDVVVG